MTATEPTPAPGETGRTPALPRRRGPLRRLYDWVLHWADTPHATPALFGLSLAESSFFPIPPDVLLVPLCLGDRRKALRFAFWCSLASVLGGVIGYGIGALLWEGAGVKEFFLSYVFSAETFYSVRKLYEEWSFWIVFVAAFTPIPYKVITITAGVMLINFPMFVLASAVGRSARFYLVAFLLARWGAPVQSFIERHFGWVTLAVAALGIGGFVVLKYVV